MSILPCAAAGLCDGRHFVRGWHDPLTDSRFGIAYRSSGACAEFLLEAPRAGKHSVFLLVSAPVALFGGSLQVRIHFHGGTSIMDFASDLWRVEKLEIETLESGVVGLVFEPERVVRPDTILGNGDRTELGFYLSSGWIVKS